MSTVDEARARRIRRAIASALAIGLALVLSGCAVLAPFSEPGISAEERAAYDAAMGRLPSDSAGATRALEGFVATYPRSALADDALEQLSQLAFASGEQEAGLRLLGRILTSHPESDRATPARLRLAQLEYARDKRAAARQLLAPLDLSRLSVSDQRAALRLRVALAQTPVERLEHLSALRAALIRETQPSEDVPLERAKRIRLLSRLDAVDRDIQELVARSATAELQQMISGLRGRTPAATIALELSRRALDGGQLELARDRLERTGNLVSTDFERGELRRLEERLLVLLELAQADAELPPLRELVDRARPRTEGASGTLGVVLPLSGDFAYYGEESLRGILLAAGLFDDAADGAEQEIDGAALTDRAVLDRSADLRASSRLAPLGVRGQGVRLVVRDSEGDPNKAAAAVRELASDPSLLAIVGPIFSAESSAAASAAEEVGVPLVTLSTREDVPAGRTQAFRTRTRPDDEVGVLVEHAFDALGAKRFAVLYPKTRYGRGMRKLYWEAVAARGGKMVAASSYDPDAVDFASAIRNMIGYRFLTNDERKALAARDEALRSARRLPPEEAAALREAAYAELGPENEPLPPIVDFDVLFIPDMADKIALIAPGLAFHEIRGVRLLGASDWVDEELLRVGRQHVSGAIVSTPFYPESDLPFVAEFVGGYRNTFGAEPNAYSAEAFDATNLILVQLAAGRGDRNGVRSGLLDMRAYPGATGVLTMHPNGNARRRPFLLEISGSRFRPLD